MSRHVVSGLLIAAVLAATASLAAASVPDPANSSVSWAGPFLGTCTIPAICPKGDLVGGATATVNVTVKDQFNAPMAGIPANEVEATGTCLLGGGSPCAQVLSIYANAATNGSGFTTITTAKAGGCCTDLQIRARGITLATLSYLSFDYTADLEVGLPDLGFLADTYNKSFGDAGYNACFNFTCDGTPGVGLPDLGHFADHYNHKCL